MTGRLQVVETKIGLNDDDINDNDDCYIVECDSD